MIDDANALLMSGGITHCKFDKVGTVWKGVITNVEMQQQRDYESGELKFYDDGKPMMQFVVTLATDVRENDDDDGLRKLYIKGQMTVAVRDACRKAGSPEGLSLGGTLAVKYIGDAEPRKAGMRGAKQYTAQYQPPAHAVGEDEDLF